MSVKKRIYTDYPVRQSESLSVGTTAVGVTSSYVRRGGIIVDALDVDVRWRADGTDPTADVGHLLAAGERLQVKDYTTAAAIKFISATGVTANLFVSHLG